MIEAADRQFLRAQNFLREGKVDECMQELNLILARQPEYGKGQALQGHLLLHYFQDFVNAEESFKKAMRLEPSYGETYLDYGLLLLRLERLTETVAILNKSMEVPGIEKDKVYRVMGMLSERQEKWDEAIDNFSKAIAYTFSNEALTLYEADILRIQRKRSSI